MVMEFIEHPVTVNYLQICDSREIVYKHHADFPVEIVKLEDPEPNFLRCLYRTVGRKWNWADRYYWELAQWHDRLSQPDVNFYLMEYQSSPAGYYELESHDQGDIEVSYFGLMPKFLGKGLGGYMLARALEDAFELGALRVWLHTCSLDHPNALSNYLSRGMRVYKTERQIQLLPKNWEH